MNGVRGWGWGEAHYPDWAGARWNAALPHQLPDGQNFGCARGRDAGANPVKDCGSAAASTGHALPPSPVGGELRRVSPPRRD